MRNYEAHATMLVDKDARGDPIAIGLVKQLTSSKYLGLIHLCADVLNTTNHLQCRDVSFSTLRVSINDCIEILEGMKTADGPHLTTFHKVLIYETVDDATTVHFKGQKLNVAPKTRADDADLDDDFSQISAAVVNRSFAGARQEFLEAPLVNIWARFPQVELLESMQIFQPSAYPKVPNNLVYWGNTHLDMLLQHYGQSRENRDGVVFDAFINLEICKG